MRVKWQRRALRQLIAIHESIAANGPAAADRIAFEIDQSAQKLKSFPLLGRQSDKIGLRLLQVPGRPYVLIYSITPDVIDIASVFDQRRNPEDMI